MSKGLQKLPDSREIDNLHEPTIRAILIGEKLTKEKYDALPFEERMRLYNAFREGSTHLGFDDRDKFLEKIESVLAEDTRRSLWGMNHSLVLIAINKFTSDNGRFPSRVELSQATGLSRQTINKHLKAYFGSQEYHEKQEDFVIMREGLLAKIYAMACRGDIKAAKLFIEATSQLKSPTMIKHQQNNFIQVNGTVITEEQLKQLPEEQQVKLNEVLSLVIPQPQKI